MAVGCNPAASRADKAFQIYKTITLAVDKAIATATNTPIPDETLALAEFRHNYKGDDLVFASIKGVDSLAQRLVNVAKNMPSVLINNKINSNNDLINQYVSKGPQVVRYAGFIIERTKKENEALLQKLMTIPVDSGKSLIEVAPQIAQARKDLLAIIPKS